MIFGITIVLMCTMLAQGQIQTCDPYGVRLSLGYYYT
jgi:hypothetical protein